MQFDTIKNDWLRSNPRFDFFRGGAFGNGRIVSSVASKSYELKFVTVETVAVDKLLCLFSLG